MSNAPAVSFEDRTVEGRHGDFSVRDYLPAAAAHATPFVWVHGGGFGSGGLDMEESHAVALAIAARGRRVTTVDYHLVPAFTLVGPLRLKPSTHRFPVPVDDVEDAFRQVVAREGGRVILGGASAGACLAASAAQRLQVAGGPAPAGLLLVYGLFHAHLPAVTPELRRRLRGIAKLGIAPEMVRRMTLNYAGTSAIHSDTQTFPGTADVAGLPPTLLLDADHDALRASGEAFHQHLVAQGVPSTSQIVPEARHGFLDKPGNELFDAGVKTMCDWLQQHDL